MRRSEEGRHGRGASVTYLLGEEHAVAHEHVLEAGRYVVGVDNNLQLLVDKGAWVLEH